MNYEIVTHDQKTFAITEQQKDAIYKLSGTGAKGVDVNGEFIFFGNIARIQKSEYQPQTFMLKEVLQTYSETRRKKALQSMINGFKNHFKGREIPANSQAMLDTMLQRYGN